MREARAVGSAGVPPVIDSSGFGIRDSGFGKQGLLTGLLLFLTSLVWYGAVLWPDIPFGDAGDLVTASWLLGSAHPPGYPLYGLLLAPFLHLPLIEPALGANLFSAFCVALGLGVLAWGLIREGLAVPVVLTALTFVAVGKDLTETARGAEVYGLHWLLIGGLMVLMAQADTPKRLPRVQSPGRLSSPNPESRIPNSVPLPFPHIALAITFLTALGLGNHHLLLVFAVPWSGLVLGDQRLRKRLAIHVTLAILGLSTYLLLPLRAVHSASYSWGDPSTWDRFLDVLLRRQYQPPEVSGAAATLGWQLSHAAEFLAGQWVGWPVGVGFWALAGYGMWWWRKRNPKAALAGGVVLAGHTVVVTLLSPLDTMIFDRLIPVFFLPAYAIGAMAVAHGFPQGGKRRWAWIAAAMLTVATAVTAFQNFQDIRRIDPYLPRLHAANLLRSVEQDSVLLEEWDDAYFPLQYIQRVKGEYPQITVLSWQTVGLEWGWEEARRRHPALALPPFASLQVPEGSQELFRELLTRLVSRQPLYADVTLLKELEPLVKAPWFLEPQGIVLRIWPEPPRKTLEALQEMAVQTWEAIEVPGMDLDDPGLDSRLRDLLTNYGLGAMFQANFLREIGASEAALPLYSLAHRWAPFDPQSYFHEGVAYQRLNRRREARQAFQRCLDIDPKAPGVREMLQALEDSP